MEKIYQWKGSVQAFDERRNLIIAGSQEETVQFCVNQFIQIGQEAIAQRGRFYVALSGGQTPNAIFKELSKPIYLNALDWSSIICFWSDERNAPPTSPENNYYSAMQAGLASLPLLAQNILRMPAEENIEKNATVYEQLIREKVPSASFDLLMLGVGEDGHTASLFPETQGLHAKEQLVIANFIPQKKTWRMSFTYSCIDLARVVCIYAIGSNKAKIVSKVLLGPYDPVHFPVQQIGTPQNKAYWILDTSASEMLML